METTRLSFETGSAGRVSAAVTGAESAEFMYVFAHGAGAGMDHPFMARLSAELAKLKIGTFRFNFPYMEKGAKRPDPPAIAERTVVDAIARARELFPNLPLLAGGKSFGGRMTSQALSRPSGPEVRGLVFVGFPLHPAGRPGTERAAHLSGVRQPMLFLQGTRDALATMELMEGVCAQYPGATLEKFTGADHSFKAGKTDLLPDIAGRIRTWADDLQVQPH